MLNEPLTWVLTGLAVEYKEEDGRRIWATVEALPEGPAIEAKVKVEIDMADLFDLSLTEIENIAVSLAKDYVARGFFRIERPQDEP